MRSTIVITALVIACSEARTPGSAFEAYEEGNITVIGGAEGDHHITLSSPVGEGECVEVSDNLCVPAETSGDWCPGGDGPVDIIVVDGQVVDVVCYPSSDNDGKPQEIVGTDQQGNIEVLQTANQTAITFDPATDGQPIVGDVDVDGNGVSIYGNGPDKTIIDGNVSLGGNKVRLRGVTITGNLELSKNTVSVILCRVLGNVTLTTASTNNSIFVENDVFGNFTADSNNNTLTGNDVQGNWSITGRSDTCDANAAFSDANANDWVDDGEGGAELSCPP